MRRSGSIAFLLLATAGCAGTAMAQDSGQGTGIAVGVLAGTNGLGLEVGYRFNERFGVHANNGAYSYDHTVDSGDFDIDGKAKLKSIGLLADFYPLGGSFRISAGLRSNHNKFDGVATPNSSTVEIGGDTYTASQVGTLVGAAKFKKTAPTLLVGWAGHYHTGLHFGVELGVVAQGSPRLAATSNGSLASNPTFQADLADKLAEWQDDVKDYKLWPVVQMHLAYRF